MSNIDHDDDAVDLKIFKMLKKGKKKKLKNIPRGVAHTGTGAGIGVPLAVATERRLVALSIPVAVDIESPAVVASR